jgi:hypothetical protein
VIHPGSFGQSVRARPVEFVIQTAENYGKLEEYVNRVIAEVQAYPGLNNVESDLDLNKPQIRVEMYRDRVADRGVSVLTVGQTLETLLGGRQVTRFIQSGEQYDVIVQVQPDARRTPGDLADIYVRGRNGTMVQLTSIVQTEETVAPKELNRFNSSDRRRSPRPSRPATRWARPWIISQRPPNGCCPTQRVTTIRGYRASSRSREPASISSSSWRSASSSWSWPHSSSASSIR